MKKSKDNGQGSGKDQSRKAGVGKSESKKDWGGLEDQGSDTQRKGSKSGQADRDTSSKEDR